MYRIIWICSLVLFCNTHGLHAQSAPYRNARLSVEERVADLLRRMTVEEKAAQMCQYVGIEHIKAAEKKRVANGQLHNDAYAFYPGLTTDSLEKLVTEGKVGSFLHVVTAAEANHLQQLAARSRLKIPLLIGIDAIHGNGMVSGCTIFPSPLSMSCSWDTAMQQQIAAVTAKEMKATGSQWAFSPNLDIVRDPRWGRTGETFGEDPFIVAQMGVATIRGLQENGVAACAKHLVAGSQPVNGLNKAPSDISERTLNEIFLPPYRAAVQAGVMSVMPAHNELNGVPCHAHKALMTGLLRETWHFNGFYISDWMDIERMADLHKTVSDNAEAYYASMDAGMDMHMHGPGFLEAVVQMVRSGRLPEARLDSSAARILRVKFRAGLFEAPLVSETSATVFTKPHQALAKEAAVRSIVLLKNNGILPLKTTAYKRVLVTGPNANNQAALGDWSLQQPDEQVVTVYEGIKAAAPRNWEVVLGDCGRFIPDMKDSSVQQVVRMADRFDLIIAVVGDNSLRFEGNKRTAGENTDMDDIVLKGMQQQLLDGLHATGKPVVAVLINGRPLALPWLDAHLPAVVEAWEPGSFGGSAVADVLFGKANPSGKLTVSLLRNVGQTGNYYNHRPSQYALKYTGKKEETGPLYPFGFGLSYTTYQYGNLRLSNSSIQAGQPVTAAITVTNTGTVAGDEVVQLYVHGSKSAVTKPVMELKGFQRVHLEPKQAKEVTFLLTPEAFMSYDIHLRQVTEPGIFTIMAGSSSREADLKKQELRITNVTL
jgi:beta-glucosidase